MASLLGLRFGTFHSDLKDDEAGWTSLIPLGILPENSHGGCFFDARLGSYIEWDLADPGLYVFKGSDPHVGSPAAPPPTYPNRDVFYSRSVVVAYPSRSASIPEAATAIDSLSLTRNYTLFKTAQLSLPFLSQRAGIAAAGGEDAASFLLVVSRSRATFDRQLRAYLEWHHSPTALQELEELALEDQVPYLAALELAIEAGLARLKALDCRWETVARFEAALVGLGSEDAAVDVLARGGNPYGWVEGEEQAAYSPFRAKGARKAAEEKARMYFEGATRSAVKMRNMVKHGATSGGAAYLLSRGFEGTLVATKPKKLFAILADKGLANKWLDEEVLQ